MTKKKERTVDQGGIFNDKYFSMIRRFLKLMALWPYGGKSTKKQIARVIIVLSMISFLIPLISRGVKELFSEVTKVEIVTENFVGCLLFVGGIVKYIMSVQAEQEYILLFEYMTQKWKELEASSGEISIMRRYLDVGLKIGTLFAIYCYNNYVVCVTFTTFLPMLLNFVLPGNHSFEKSLCSYFEYFVDEEEYYYYMFLHHVYAVGVYATIMAGFGVTYFQCVQYVLGLFKVIEFRLNETRKFVNDTVTSSRRGTKFYEDYVHERIHNVIMLHQESIEFVKTVQSIYNTMFFTHSVLYVLGISAWTVILVTNIHNPINLLRIFALWLGLTTYMFMLNWPGQKLLDASEQLHAAIYACGWYEFPRKTQTLIKIMMLRSAIPCKLTGGPMITMSYETFGSILRLSWSYFTVLLSLKE